MDRGRLALGIRVGEKVQIGPDIEIQFVQSGPQRIRIVIVAPKDVEIIRPGWPRKERHDAHP